MIHARTHTLTHARSHLSAAASAALSSSPIFSSQSWVFRRLLQDPKGQLVGQIEPPALRVRGVYVCVSRVYREIASVPPAGTCHSRPGDFLRMSIEATQQQQKSSLSKEYQGFSSDS